MGLLREYLNNQDEDKRKILETKLSLLKDQANAGTYTPDEVNQAAYSRGPDGLISLPTQRRTLVPGTTDQFHYDPIKFAQKNDPNELVQVTPDLGKTLKITPGYYPRWQVEKIYAPQERATTLAGGQDNRQDKGFVHAEQLQKAQQEFETYKQGEQEKKDFRKEMRKIITDPEADGGRKKLATDSLQILEDTDALPQFSTEQTKILGFIPHGEKTVVKPATGASRKPAPAADPSGGYDQAVMDYLKQVGAKDTPANRDWAKKKLGK